MASRNESIAIDIGAVDNASPVIDRLAKRIDGMEADEARIVVSANVEKLEAQLDRARLKLETLSGDEATVQARLIGTLEEDLEQAQDLFNHLDGQTGTVTINAKGDAESKLDGITAKLGELGGSAEGAVPGMSQLMTAASAAGPVGVGIAGMAGAMVALGMDTANAAIEVGTLADLTGLSADNASRLAQVWQGAGLDLADLQDVILQVNGALQQSPELAAQLGINMDAGLTPAQLFLAAVEGVNKEMDASTKATMGSTLFGEEGVRQVQKVNTLVGDIGTAMENIPEGAVFSDQDIAKAVEFKRKMGEISLQIKALGTEIGTLVLPVLMSVVDEASNFADAIEITSGFVDDVGAAIAGLPAFPEMPEWASGGIDLVKDAFVNALVPGKAVVESIIAMGSAADEAAPKTSSIVDGWVASITKMPPVVDAAGAASERAARKARLLADNTAAFIGQYDIMTGRINTSNAALDLADAFDEAATNAGKLYLEILDKSPEVEQTARDQARLQNDLKLKVIEYADELGKLPPEKITEINALIDQGDLTTAEKQLETLTRNRNANIRIILAGGAGYGPVAPGSGPRSAPASMSAQMTGVPTSQQISRQIGTVRVPMDVFVRSTPRITGIRQ